jgi:hypothetical protein
MDTMRSLKEILEGVFDIEDNIDKLELIDLYSLIKDRIKTMNYSYNYLGVTHFFDEKKCGAYIKKHNISPLKTVDGKLATGGKLFTAILPVLLKDIYVFTDFINHKDDNSMVEKSAIISSKFMEDNNLIKDKNDHRPHHVQDKVYITVQMKKGALIISYGTTNNIDNVSSNRMVHAGQVRITLIK